MISRSTTVSILDSKWHLFFYRILKSIFKKDVFILLSSQILSKMENSMKYSGEKNQLPFGNERERELNKS